MMKKNKIIYIYALISLIIIFFMFFLFRYSYAVTTQESIRVKENSDLTYYIDVIYDGKDENLIMSSDTGIAEVRSGYIYVEDKLPDGLTFKEFVSSSDGTIGAVQRSDETKSCAGYVVDGVDGLQYDNSTRMITFKIKNLQAGCKVTVGIVTTTPSLDDQSRMDFYNTAFAREEAFSASSNTTHAFIGEVEETLYTVNYQYEGDVPSGAPELPTTTSYSAGTTVGVNNDITLDGYTFSGWKTADVEVTDSSFEMPESNVTFIGSFEKKPTYTVSYEISGTTPDGYLVPKTKEYGEGDTVTLDSLQEDDEINGYRFLGWKIENLTLTDGTFIMPNESIVITGEFEKISYTVTYQFQGETLPEDYETLLPETKSYYPDEIITLEEAPVASGYKFLGWYYSDNFKMPAENIVIYGEWMIETGTFTPTITKEILNPKDYYTSGDIIEFKITVTNPADFEIKNVMLQEHLEGGKFTANENYTLLNDQFIQISTIAANSSIDVYATYTVGTEPLKEIANTITLNGALADNNYTLDTNEEYKATTTFNVANIELQINKVDEDNNSLTGAEFSLYSDSAMTDLISIGTVFQKLIPNTTYYLKETKAPAGFILLGKNLTLKVDDQGVVSIESYEVNNNEGIATVNITNEKINILPNTGGIGNIPFVLIGLIIISASIFGYLNYLNKKKRVDKHEKD